MSLNPYQSPSVVVPAQRPARDESGGRPNLLLLLITTVFIIPPMVLIAAVVLALVVDWLTKAIMSWF